MMKTINFDWYESGIFLPIQEVPVFVIYLAGKDDEKVYRCDLAVFTKDESKINTKENFYIEYLSPLLVKNLGTPMVTHWTYVPNL